MIRFTILGEPELVKRFMAIAFPEPMSGCWLWSGAPGDGSPTGAYGKFRVRGIQERAHRVSWLLHKGDIPLGLQVLHRCDNPPCVNPEHLFLGTNSDNVADRMSKGRSGWLARKGELHPLRKLTEQSVREIRQRYSAGEQGRALAREFKVHPATISEIVNLRTWAHIA